MRTITIFSCLVYTADFLSTSVKLQQQKVKDAKDLSPQFFEKPTLQNLQQANSLIGDVTEDPIGPKDPAWFHLVTLPNKGVTQEIDTPALVSAVDQYPVTLFNVTDSNYTVFGFPEAELHTEMFHDLPDMDNLPTHVPKVVTEDPAEFAVEQEPNSTVVEEETIAELDAEENSTAAAADDASVLDGSGTEPTEDSTANEETGNLLNVTNPYNPNVGQSLGQFGNYLGQAIGNMANKAEKKVEETVGEGANLLEHKNTD